MEEHSNKKVLNVEVEDLHDMNCNGNKDNLVDHNTITFGKECTKVNNILIINNPPTKTLANVEDVLLDNNVGLDKKEIYKEMMPAPILEDNVDVEKSMDSSKTCEIISDISDITQNTPVNKDLQQSTLNELHDKIDTDDVGCVSKEIKTDNCCKFKFPMLDESIEESLIVVQDEMDVEEIKEVQEIKEPKEDTTIQMCTKRNISEKPIICKLSNTLDILSDDDVEPPRIESQVKKVEQSTKEKAFTQEQSMNIKDDDEIMLIDEDIPTQTKLNTHVEIGNNDKIQSPKKSDTDSDMESGERCNNQSDDIFSNSNGKESILPAVPAKKSVTDTKENPVEKEPKKLKPQKLLLPEIFLFSANKNLADMTRKDLEEFCILKIVESIVNRSSLSDIKAKLKAMTQNIEEYRNKAMILTEQNRDLQVVLKSVQEEQKKMTDLPITPLKITRSVGIQVLMADKLTARRKTIKTSAPKAARKRQHNRIQSDTVELTDEEPPRKMRLRNSSATPVRLVRLQNLMPPHRQPYTPAAVNSPRKVYIRISGPQNQAIRSGQAIMLKPVGGLARCAPPQPPRMQNPVRRVTCGRHPAPLPNAMKQYHPPNWKALLPTPDLKLSKVENGIVITWNIEGYHENSYEEIASYQLYAYQETSSPPSTTLWKEIGDFKALPLPMACTVSQLMAGFKYFFAVRAVDVKSRLGPFSLPGSILLNKIKRKSNAERQREYRQREKIKNIAEKKKKSETEKEFREKQNTDESKLKHAASVEAYRDRRKSNAERQREYRQREKIKNIAVNEIIAEKKEKAETEKEFKEKQNTDERKLKNAASSKAYRDRKKIEKFSNIESEIKSQNFISHKHIVDPVASTSGTIHNVPDSSEESQRHIHNTSPIANNKNVPIQCETRPEESIHRENLDEIVPFVSQSVQQNNQVCREINIEVNRHEHIENERDRFEFEGGVNDGDFEEKSSDYDLIEPNPNPSIRPNQNDIHQTSTSAGEMGKQPDAFINKYKDYRHVAARIQFHKQFTQNPFGHACKICDRLWFKNDLKFVKEDFRDLFRQIIENYQDGSTVAVCSTCHVCIKKNKIPNLSKYNGFKYPDFPTHLPKLDIISERLISPRLPFMQIKRLRHYGQPGQYKMYGQIINVPVEVNNMVRNLPRHLDDEHSIYIHIKKKNIHKSYDLRGLVNKQNIQSWLRFLVDTPLYREYGISINESFFNDDDTQSYNDINDVSEHIPVEETLTAQQQTLLWDEDKLLCIAPGKGKSPIISLLFDEHAEELSFPAIYLGQFRKYEITVTAFMQASSELRRADRRGATPNHILYLAMKIMRLRVRDSLTVAFKHTSSSDSITKEQIMDTDYINNCIESNLAFLRSIPNSTWYWSARKRDLFAMIRQLGKPTAFMTLSYNEVKWIPLLKILHKLKNNCTEISTEAIEQLSPMERSDLVNEDPVTCAIYFNKLVNVLMSILMSRRNSPFGKYNVIHYFKRIELQNVGSPHAHILLWLKNAPNAVLDKNYNEAIKMINSLSSVSAAEASGNMKLNMHKHTDTGYEKITNQQYEKCRFDAPFMPSKQTVILSPMGKDDENYSTFRKQYDSIRNNLESYSYTDFDDFYNQNSITSDQQYYDIIRAGINRSRVFIKRLPSEKWHNPFNPFVFNLLQSNMDFQLILDEYSCAQYVAEYVNKTDRGISNLQNKIIQAMDEHPEFDIVEITRKMSVEMLNTVEMTSQEAAWYLLREPLFKSSTAIVYIPTVPPHERQKIRKSMEDLEILDNESTDLWKENIFDKYEKRPEYLNDVSLAQFVSKYYKQIKTGKYVQRKDPKIISYRNYNMIENFNEYRREMVTLHIPFKNEQDDILLDNKYINTYEEKKDIIMENSKEFESDLDIEKTMKIVNCSSGGGFCGSG